MKFRKRIAAVAAAAFLGAQCMAITASATDYYYYNGYYYSYLSDALDANGNTVNYVVVSDTYVPTSSPVYYSSTTNSYYSSLSAAQSAGVSDAHLAYAGTYSGYTSSSAYTTGWYSSVTGKTYSTYSAALAASNYVSSYVTPLYGSSYYYGYGTYYVSTVTGKSYSTYSAALSASGGDSSKVVTYNNGYYNNYYNYYNSSYVGYSSPIYRYYYNGVYYPTLSAAISAGGTQGVDIYYTPVGSTSDTTNYYYYNGTYYGSLQAAKNAGGTAVGVDIYYVPYGYYSYYGSYYYPYYSTYANGYYWNGVGDPYYTYRTILNSTSSSSSSSKEAEDGEPYISGYKTKCGWDTIVKYAKAASSGTNIKVNMNGAYEVDKDVLEAIDGRNVSITFVLDNGVKWTVNGKNVDKAQDMVIYTEYNIQYIPDELVAKAAKGAISKAQVGLSTSFDDFGSKATVTVSFDSTRSGCTAVVYRYNPDTNSLKGISKVKVQSDGSVSFNVTAGGPYLIVLK